MHNSRWDLLSKVNNNKHLRAEMNFSAENILCAVLLFSFVFEARSETIQNVQPTDGNTTKSASNVLILSGTSKEVDDEQLKAIKLSLPIPKDYEKWEIPLDVIKNRKVYTYVSIFIRGVLDINQKDKEIVLDTDFGLQWVDWKIVKHMENSQDETTDFHHRTLDSEFLRHIWKPDVYIDEMSSVQQTSVISKLVTLNFFGLKSGTYFGDFMYSARKTLKLRCDMSFQYYPADTQTCKYYIRSYSYNASKFDLFWNRDDTDDRTKTGIYLNDPKDPNFDIQISSAGPTKSTKLYVWESFDDFRQGNYSTLTFTLQARRKLSYHLVQTYLPSVLLILITWICFLLPEHMVEARIGIAMTTVLTLTAMFAAIRQQSPVVSYTMAIDIWMVFCIFFVFTALILFTSMYWMMRQLKKDPNPVKKYVRRMEFLKRYTFPVFAIILISFLIIYWTWLLLSSNYLLWKPNPEYNGSYDEDESNSTKNHYRYHETDGEDQFPYTQDTEDSDEISTTPPSNDALENESSAEK